jgi:hypothetical protein
MHKDRAKILRKIERLRSSKALLYVTGDRRGMEAQISKEAIPSFVDHLDLIGDVDRISLILHTAGGDVLAAWSITNLIRQFCKELEVIVPYRAHSAGTLMSLGADKIILTKQATLGPIDPSVQRPLNPQIPGGGAMARVPVSVEELSGYMEFVRNSVGKSADLTPFAVELSRQIHPLVLGAAFRARSQIRMLGQRLLSPRIKDQEMVKKVVDFLCSESGSHDYTINRKEAAQDLGLPIEKPDMNFYKVIRALHDDVADELLFSTPFDPGTMATPQGANYSVKRALVESVKGGSNYFASEGELKRMPHPQHGEVVHDKRNFEGWRHEK